MVVEKKRLKVKSHRHMAGFIVDGPGNKQLKLFYQFRINHSFVKVQQRVTHKIRNVWRTFWYSTQSKISLENFLSHSIRCWVSIRHIATHMNTKSFLWTTRLLRYTILWRVLCYLLTRRKGLRSFHNSLSKNELLHPYGIVPSSTMLQCFSIRVLFFCGPWLSARE